MKRHLQQTTVSADGFFSTQLDPASLSHDEIRQLLRAAAEVAALAGGGHILAEEGSPSAAEALGELAAVVDAAWLRALPCPTPLTVVERAQESWRHEPSADGDPRKLRLVEPAEQARQG